jgi:acyl-CoA synthetase (AMP-forming)/AMP-acid ligase II
MNIAERILRHAHQGDRDALIDFEGGRRRSWADLADRVTRLADGLESHLGLAMGDKVAVLSRNALEYMELLLACALAGIIVQALNWRLSTAELAQILRTDAPDAVVFAGEQAAEAAALRAEIDGERWFSWAEGGGPSAFEELVERSRPSRRWEGTDLPGGDDPFLVVYTGGTTGVSKGAVHTHDSAIAAMAQNALGERLVTTDRFMLMGQMFHSPVITAMDYLTHGCPLVIVNFKPEVALAAIQEERVTASMGIPTMYQNMIPLLQAGGWDVSSLRNLQYGGSPTARNVVFELMELFGCGLIQCYGRTEELAITFLSQEDHVLAARGDRPERLDTVGREAWFTRIRLLGDDGTIIPRSSGATGEILSKSPAAMSGYLGRPDLTADATWGDGWLRTGDLGRFDDHGYLSVVGRAKDLIISGGENIYPVQVENAIQKHPAVLEVAVVGVPDELWGESVKAYVVVRPGMQLTEAEVVASAAVNLASYQKPKYVEFLPELPKSGAGKIDKRVLKERP